MKRNLFAMCLILVTIAAFTSCEKDVENPTLTIVCPTNNISCGDTLVLTLNTNSPETVSVSDATFSSSDEDVASVNDIRDNTAYESESEARCIRDIEYTSASIQNFEDSYYIVDLNSSTEDYRASFKIFPENMVSCEGEYHYKQ